MTKTIKGLNVEAKFIENAPIKRYHQQICFSFIMDNDKRLEINGHKLECGDTVTVFNETERSEELYILRSIECAVSLLKRNCMMFCTPKKQMERNK